MRKIFVAGLMLFTVSIVWAQLPLPKIVQRQLGDINDDGIQEIAVEEWSSGSSGDSAMVTILVKKRVVLGPFGLSGGTADGYKVVGRRVVVWQGDWDKALKWDPHYYDFVWYEWDKKSRQFKVIREGRTKKAYTYQRAQKTMPMLASRPGESLKTAPSLYAGQLKLMIDCYYVKPDQEDIIYQRAKKLPSFERDRFILSELGELQATGQTAKQKPHMRDVHYSLYKVHIAGDWAQVSYRGGPAEAGADIFHRSQQTQRWELIGFGNEFGGLIRDGIIPRSVAQKIKIY